VEYGLRRNEEEKSFMPHFTQPNHNSATCTLADVYAISVVLKEILEQKGHPHGGIND
jgi:hypothetical protein